MDEKRHRFEKFISMGLVVFAIVFNLWLYRLEPTALVDPNDNHFQYALVDRTNQIWDFANKTCSKNLSFGICHLAFLVDHWVPNWAQGYNLPYYYSHLPQIAIVGSYRLFNLLTKFSIINFQFSISLFQYYHLVIYALLSFFPLMVFWALRVVNLPFLTAGIGALLASHISTDGLYGLDPPSFLWRGYGLSSQLFAMIWLPLAIAYSYKFLSGEENGRQFLRELAFWHRKPMSMPDEPKRHLAREEEGYDADKTDRASRKNSSAGSFWQAVFFLVATTAGHLGIGIIALLSVGFMALSEPVMLLLTQHPFAAILASTKQRFIRLAVLSLTTLFFLSYWVIPLLIHNNYHNISVWDPIWKFNSYGAKETIVRFLNGELFDFGRFPVFTLLTLIGFFAALLSNQPTNLLSFSFLFAVWFLLYFGRTTWGGLIDLIPGMGEFHISRFIVGLHAAGLFLAPIGFQYVANLLWRGGTKFLQLASPNFVRGKPELMMSQAPALGERSESQGAAEQENFRYAVSHVALAIVLCFLVYSQTIRYSTHNDFLIKRGNADYKKVETDVNSLILYLTSYISEKPGRVFAGRGGGWGKDFRVAETPYFMHLSTYGIPVVLWLPETWSPNSDTEQYFSEDQASHYSLYNIRYVVAPPSQAPQPFWKLMKETKTWKLYEVDTKGYITSGTRPAIVATDKESFANVVRLWIQSDNHTKGLPASRQGLYPELTFAKDFPKATGLPNFKMIDEVTYKVPDGTTHNLFSEPPLYMAPYQATGNKKQEVAILSQESDSDMVFTAQVDVPKDCVECVVILKQTFHPNWRATIDGKSAPTLTVFPFFVATGVTEGQHTIAFSYQPSSLKTILLSMEILALLSLVGLRLKKRLV